MLKFIAIVLLFYSQQANSLWCYECIAYHTTPSEMRACSRFPEQESKHVRMVQCEGHKNLCQAVRQYDKDMSVVRSFRRGCAHETEMYCQNNEKFETCTQLCTVDGCNTGNGRVQGYTVVQAESNPGLGARASGGLACLVSLLLALVL